jgi:hypothetical protein
MGNNQDFSVSAHRSASCREQASPEEILDLVGKWIVEVVWDYEFSLCRPKLETRWRGFDRNQLCHGLAGFSDDDLFAECDALKQPREVGLGFVNIDFHTQSAFVIQGLQSQEPS